MFRKKYIFISFLCVFVIFFCFILYCSYIINFYNSNSSITYQVKLTTDYSIEKIEHELKLKVISLPKEYQVKHQTEIDSILNKFNNNLIIRKDTNLRLLWQEFDIQVNETQIFDSTNPNIGNVIHALKTAKILHADIYSKGTQLKLIFELEGGHLAVFKPQWYNKDKIIIGNVYAGKDRSGSEILAFYLAAMLDLRLVPIATSRTLNLKKEILPVASNLLNNTKFEINNRICIYGKCFYCKKEDPICANADGELSGAILFHIKGKLKSYNSPWQRTYKKDKKALWEIQSNYCSVIRKKNSNKRLLDLIDVSIFDFLIQNGDRHHYQTLNDKVVLIDNGKGLGNPYVHHIDILAPLYQCCSLRSSTWERLKIFSGGLLQKTLESFSEIKNVVSINHLKAIDERLQIIYATIEKCRERNKFL